MLLKPLAQLARVNGGAIVLEPLVEAEPQLNAFDLCLQFRPLLARYLVVVRQPLGTDTRNVTIASICSICSCNSSSASRSLAP